MNWLIITESEDKASIIREALPKTPCLSTKGFPFELEIKLQGKRAEYKVVPKLQWESVLEKVRKAAFHADRVLIAYDPTPIGEACCVELEKLLGKKCARWYATSLAKKDIKALIETLEEYPIERLPKASKNIANTHWCQAFMDIVWTESVKNWLKKKTSLSIPVTPLMANMLRIIDEERRKMELFQKRVFWEVRGKVKFPGGKERYDVEIVVPTQGQLEKDTGELTRQIWRRKIEEAEKAARQGTGIPQPAPGKPWRFDSKEEALAQKNHMTRFPFFLTESVIEIEIAEPDTTAPTAQSLLEWAAQENISTESLQKAIRALYLEGWITQPKSDSVNIGSKSFLALKEEAKRRGIPISEERKIYDEPYKSKPLTEAIQPTSWERGPETTYLLKDNDLKKIKERVYKKIWETCIESQMNKTPEKKVKAYLAGPLYLTLETAKEKNGKEFTINREHSIQAHMAVVLGAKAPPGAIKRRDVLQCCNIEIEEKELIKPPELKKETLYQKMMLQGLGKKDRLIALTNILKENECIEEKNEEIRLTKKGEELKRILTENFGPFIDKNYHKTIEENLSKIETGEINPETFIGDWWDYLETILKDNPQ